MNALDPRLTSSRAKFDRAKKHADDLIAEMREASEDEPPAVLATSRRYDPASERVLFIAERVPEIPDHWSLVIGEVVYNLRCALDHLWWALAVDFLGREPTDAEAREIQFPILDRLDPAKWEGHRFLSHVSKEAAEKAKPLQCYEKDEGEEPLLRILADLSNTDKHREVKPTLFITSTWSFPMGELPCRDCHIPNDGGDPPIWESDVEFGTEQPRAGDVVLGVKVVPTGPAPDIDIAPEITGHLGFGSESPVLLTLKELGRLVFGVINEFAPLLSSPKG